MGCAKGHQSSSWARCVRVCVFACEREVGSSCYSRGKEEELVEDSECIPDGSPPTSIIQDIVDSMRKNENGNGWFLDLSPSHMREMTNPESR